MKFWILFAVFALRSFVSYSQTVDFTINLIYELNIYKQRNLCTQYAEYSNLTLLSKTGEECRFYCSLDNIRIKADSIILIYEENYSFLYDYGPF